MNGMADTYSQGKLTMKLTHSGNNYMFRLYTTNPDNTRVPFDLTGVTDYKIVFPLANGTKLQIMANKDSEQTNMGVGTLVFYISTENAKAIMQVPYSERYFSIMTSVPQNPREESTLYEGRTEWYV